MSSRADPLLGKGSARETMSSDIEEFEDSEDPCFFLDDGEALGEEHVGEEEFDFLDGVDQLASLQSELFDVRKRLADFKSNGEYIPLRLYRSHLHNSLSVTDIQGGIWCERQLEYRYLYPHMKKTNQWKKREKEAGKEIPKKTAPMIKGSAIHQLKELEVHEVVPVKTVTKEDSWAVKLVNAYQQLAAIKEGKMEREIAVFGDPVQTGVLLTGIIDQIQYCTDTQELILTDLKTRRTNSMPGETQLTGHKLQVMLYKMLLDGLTRGSTKTNCLIGNHSLNPACKISPEVIDYIVNLGMESLFTSQNGCGILGINFDNVVKTVCSLITGLDLPPVSSLFVSYEYQETNEVIDIREVMFDSSLVTETLKSAIKFWKGEREPTGPDIEDLWKCDTCQFKDVCVWQKKKSLEQSPVAKIAS